MSSLSSTYNVMPTSSKASESESITNVQSQRSARWRKNRQVSEQLLPKPLTTHCENTALHSADPRETHALFEILREIKELRGEVVTLTAKIDAIDIQRVSADLDIVRKGTLRVLKAQLNLAGLLDPETTITPAQIKDYYNSIRPR